MAGAGHIVAYTYLGCFLFLGTILGLCLCSLCMIPFHQYLP